MIPYYAIYFLLAFAAAFEAPNRFTHVKKNRNISFLGLLFLILCSFFIGSRLYVGADYNLYSLNFDNLSQDTFADILFTLSRYVSHDIGYEVVSMVAAEFNLGFPAVTLACGTLFAMGLVKFCFSLPRPWLALAVAYPYLIVVVGMGYMRQGVALAFLMWALPYLLERKRLKFMFFIFLGCLFHKTLVLFFSLPFLVFSEGRLKLILLFIIFFPILYIAIIAETISSLQHNYLAQNQQSAGALVRLLLSTTGAALFFLFVAPKLENINEIRLWSWFSIFSILAFLSYFIVSSSTAVDRIALYLLPLQIYLFSKLPDYLDDSNNQDNFLWVLFVLIVFLLVLFVWMTYGAHSMYWLPYQTWLFRPIIPIIHI